MSVYSAIRKADSLLPGTLVEGPDDPRWQAIFKVGEHIESHPAAVWKYICRWGNHADEDLRNAIACCLLEHLLIYHFAKYFQRVEALALSDSLFGDMVSICWKFGQSEDPANSKRFDELQQRIKERCRSQ